MKELTKPQELTVAEKLYTLEEQIDFLEEQAAECRTELLASLKKQGVTFLKLENGTTYTRSHRETLKVKDEEKARAWAEEHNCLKLDTTRTMAILRRELKMPRFFGRKIGEDYLTVKKAK